MIKPNTVHGASIGILMLETRFPRIPGDPGNPESWPFPVRYHVVRGATASAAIGSNSQALLQVFIDAAADLVSQGVDGITTSCGFLSLMQRELKAAISVPVAASSLMQIPAVQSLLPAGRRVGVLTIDSHALTGAHLHAAGAPMDTPVMGTENGKEFTRVILNDERDMDIALCRSDNLQAAQCLVARYPDVGAIVLECTNMVPYAADIQAVTGLPVYSIHTFINWFQSGLAPRRFALDPH
ncbi:MAG: aspartate/glutamate racemase family protein [Granulosicoccus sp.]|nr:aspartate/glutamate racemase family protein [Granulosicoccus sp.]